MLLLGQELGLGLGLGLAITVSQSPSRPLSCPECPRIYVPRSSTRNADAETEESAGGESISAEVARKIARKGRGGGGGGGGGSGKCSAGEEAQA